MMSFVPWQVRSESADAATLVARVTRGDRAALAALYRREAGPVYRYALALCGNEAWAADVTHDAFIAFAQRPEAFEPQRGSLGAYLAGAARHGVLALWRQARTTLSPADLGGDDDASDGDSGDTDAAHASPETLLVRAQTTRELWRALDALSFVYREAVVLVDLQERPYADAARIAGIELNTLRTRLHRARARLAQLLGAGDPS